MERDLRKLNVKILISLILLLIKINKYFAFNNKQCLSLGTHMERKECRFRPGFKSWLCHLLILQPQPSSVTELYFSLHLWLQTMSGSFFNLLFLKQCCGIRCSFNADWEDGWIEGREGGRTFCVVFVYFEN